LAGSFIKIRPNGKNTPSDSPNLQDKQMQISESFGRLPLAFEINAGQTIRKLNIRLAVRVTISG
jgi:hypothetical protein